MSQKKVKALRQMEKAAVKVVYELTIKCFSNGQVIVNSNNDRVINDPLLYNSILLDGTRVVIGRWKEQRAQIEKINKENESRIIH